MKVSDFSYHLPPELIAQHPLPGRSDSRLLQVQRHGGELHDRQFRDLPEILLPGDLLVFNNTRVLPARLFAHKQTGGRVEILIERLTSDHHCTAQLRASKKGSGVFDLVLEDGTLLQVVGRDGDFFQVHSPHEPLTGVLARLGHMPLPPYISRADDAQDAERYQTIFAHKPGAVAAPTAGLHFDQALLARLAKRGVQQTHITLHVGAGTFQPVRVESIEQHHMHAEYLEVPQSACDAIAATRRRGGRVVAVGTTSVRSLETAAAGGELRDYAGESRLFIYPGFEFRVVDAIITNFHLPESTLLMLVSAFAGLDRVRRAYAHAVEQRYRFFSYGDAMILLP